MSKKEKKKAKNVQKDSGETSNELRFFQLSPTVFDEIPGKILRKAIVKNGDGYSPLEEMIATSEAAFDLVSRTEEEMSVKNAFHQLHKQFMFYRDLVR